MEAGKGCSIGVDLGGTKIAIGLFNRNRQLVKSQRFATDLSLSAAELTDRIETCIRDLLTGESDLLLGVGVGAPSSVDYETGYIRHTTNIPNLKDFPMAQRLQTRLGCPVRIDNDANTAALGEWVHGAGQGRKNMVYSTVSTGIGGGLILNGGLFRGDHDYAGEIGHMLITPGQGVLCGCGNRGCFESWAGGAHISAQVEARLAQGQKTCMTGMVPELSAIDGKILFAAWEAGDEMAGQILDQMASYLGLLYYNLYQVLNIDCYVLGGGLTHFGEPLLARIRESFHSFCRKAAPTVCFLPARLGQDFGMIGAMELLYQKG